MFITRWTLKAILEELYRTDRDMFT